MGPAPRLFTLSVCPGFAPANDNFDILVFNDLRSVRRLRRSFHGCILFMSMGTAGWISA